MTSFELHLGRPMKPSEKIAEREWYVSQILSPEKLKERLNMMKKQEVKPKQLSLFN